MNKFWFWKTWNTTYKLHTYLLMAVMVISFVFFAFYYFKGVNSVISWENFQEQKIVETSIHEFQLGPFEITVPVNVYLLFEYFQGGKLQPNLYISYVFVLVMAIAFVYLVTIFSALEKFWYFIASGLIILFLVSLRLDVLQVAGLGNSWFTIGTIAAFLLPSFYFNAFNKTATFQFRLLTFALVALLVAIVIYFMAGVKLPFLYLSVTAYVPAMVLTVIFIMMVAHEVPAGFLYLTTQAQASTGLRHFLVITIIYLLNLALIYGHDQGFISWNILYLDIYLIFSVTVFIGFWGWKHREVLYQGLMPFYPFGAYFYLAMASIALITFAFLFGTANDAPLEVLRDILVFCHLGFGLILLLYVFSNFLKLIDRDLSAWKVLYKPNRMPYETFRLGGIIVVVSLMIYNDWKGYVNNSFAGFWTSMADLYVAVGEEDVAQLYYEQGRTYGYANHHANYAKGYYYSGEFQWQQSHEYYTRANLKRPSAFALANDANVYNWEENNFKSIFSLKDALKQLPDDPYLNNNLGLFKGKVHELDSSFFLLEASHNHTATKDAAETNFTGIVATELLPVSPDSLASLFKTDNKGVNANLLGLSAITRLPLNKQVDVMKEGALSLHEATLLHNFILAKSLTISATELDKAEVLARDTVNLDYAEALKVALAHAHYLQGNVARALQLMSELSFVSASNQGKYNFVIGLWLLEQGDPEAAALAFRYAFNYNYKDAEFYMAIAETESGNLGDALTLWEKLLNASDEGERRLANTMTQVLSMNLQEVIKSTDATKYQYSRYRLGTRDTTLFTALINSMVEADYKAQSLAEMAVRQLEADRPATAQRYVQEALSLTVKSPAVRTFRQFTQLRVLASLGELDALATQLSDVTFSLNRKLDKMYYEGLLNDAGGEKALADKAFAQLAHANPFFEEGVITAAEYTRKFSKDNGAAYAILSEAVQVNKSSVRLWKAYIGEALRLGYDDYAVSARTSLQRLMLK